MDPVSQLASAGTFRALKEPLAFLRALELLGYEWIHVRCKATAKNSVPEDALSLLGRKGPSEQEKMRE
ncbi:hypothetical protein LEMLEM_LOCUS24127 [Lemmus lemmus]